MRHGKKRSSRAWSASLSICILATLMVGAAWGQTAGEAGNETPAPSDLKRITSIVTFENAEAMHVMIEGLALTYTSVRQPSPLSVIFYFPGTVLGDVETDLYPGGDVISSIKASEAAGEGEEPTARVEIALKKDLAHDIREDGEGAGLTISFLKNGEASSADSAAGAVGLRAIVPTPVENGVNILVETDGPVKDYDAFNIENPPRIVFDVFNVSSPYTKEQSVPVDTIWVKRIRHYGHENKLRIVLDTQEEYLAGYSAAPVENGLLITVSENASPAGSTPEAMEEAPAPPTAMAPEPEAPREVMAPEPEAPREAMEPEPEAAAEAAAPEPAEAMEPEPAEAMEPEPAEAMEPLPKPIPVYDESKPAWVNRIDFSSEAAGRSTLIVGATRPVKYDVTKSVDNKNVLLLTLHDANIPEYRKRPLITTRFESAVDRITPVQKPSMGNSSVLVIELRESVPYAHEQSDDLILVHFDASSIPPRPLEEAKLPAWKEILTRTEIPRVEEDESAPSDAPGGSDEFDMDSDRPREYTGEKIALDFYETDIKNVFRILREVSGKNFAIDKNVKGRVTLTLEKPVPWDQVLDLVLKMNQLGMVFEGNIIRIATLETIMREVTDKQARIRARRKARDEAKKLEPLTTRFFSINYSSAGKEIAPHIKKIKSKRGTISVDSRNNQIILTDIEEVIEKARELIRKIDQVTPQVLIEARVVEVNSDFSKELGIAWSMEGGIGADDANAGIGPQRGYDTLGGTYGYQTAMNFLAAGANSGIGFNFTKIFGSPLVINATLNALETQSKAHVLSSPKILTMDNKKATIKQGLEVPYLERDDSGGATVSFKQVDLLLEVVPSITPDDRISMEVKITKNDLAGFQFGVPIISTNEANTELLVNDGDTIVIGGIITAKYSDAGQGFPGLNKVPVVEWLFQNNNTQSKNNELLIFITPTIVKLKQRELMTGG